MRVPLFEGLGRLELARLAAQLDVVEVSDGTPVVREGEPGDALYVVAAGTFVVSAASGSDGTVVHLATLGAGDVFGEMAVFTEERRSATIRSAGPGRVLSLPRDRFLALVQREPGMFLSVAVTLSRRLHATNALRLEDERFIAARLGQVYDALPTDRRSDVLDAALLEAPGLPALETLFGARVSTVEADLASLDVTRDSAVVALRVLRERLDRDSGRAALRTRAERIAWRLAEARLWEEALGVAVHAPPQVFVTVLSRAIQSVPPLEHHAVRRWIERLTDVECTRHAELALARAALHEARADPARALDVLRRALGAALRTRDRSAGTRVSAEITRLAAMVDKSSAALRFGLSAEAETVAVASGRYRKLVCLAVGLGCAAVAMWSGIGRDAAFALLLLGMVVVMMGRVVPDFAAGLGLVAAWVLAGVATPTAALSGFASKEWIFVVAIYGLAAATASSGVLYRVGLVLARCLPSGLLAQTATLMASGLALTPLVPSSTGRAALTMPLALAVAEALRLPERSRASAMLGLGTWVGAGPLMFVFLNGSGTCLLAWGLLPGSSRARFTWVYWLVAAIPLAVLVTIGTIAVLLVLFRPERVAPASRERISLQVAILGRPTVREVATVSILLATVVGWIASPWIGLDLSLIALLGFLATVAAGSLDLRAFQALDWNFLIFFAVVLTIGQLGVTQGIDRTAAQAISGLLGIHTPGVVAFVMFVGALSVLLRLLVDQQLTVLLGSMALVPVAPSVGLDPWIVVITLLATSVAWFLPYQTPSYLVAQSASEGRMFSQSQALRVAIGHAAVTLVALALSIPYWRFLGLVR